MENNYVTFLTNYKTKYDQHEEKLNKLREKQDKLRKQIERLDKRIHKEYCNCPYWYDEIVEPIVKQIAKKIDAKNYEKYGPFGTCSRISIYFNITDNNYLSIEFRPYDLTNGVLKIADLKNYVADDIKDPNHIGCPTIEIPKDANIEWFLQYIV